MRIRCKIPRFYRRVKKLLVPSACVILFVLLLVQIPIYWINRNSTNCSKDEPIDVVYTWVNGSDEVFLESLYKYFGKDAFRNREFNHQRFDDKYELKFSLRSLEKYAPWVRHVYIVTNGQIPYWLNMDYEKVTLISHSEIFEETSNLPTFSSPAIEVHLHRIPGLSKRFIYLNDDIFMGAPVYIDDFYTESRGFIIYLAWPLPMCSTDCPWIYVSDGQCDKACFNEECQFDGNDCDTKKVKNSKGQSLLMKNWDEYEVDYDSEMLKDESPHRKLLQIHENTNNTTLNYNLFMKKHKHPLLKPKQAKNELAIVKYSNDKNEKHIVVNFSSHNNILDETKHLKLNETHLPQVIKEHNARVMKIDRIRRKKRFWRNRNTIHHRLKPLNNDNNLTNNSDSDKITNNNNKKNTAEAYALSLQHTNRILNNMYGFKPRYVPVHSAIMIDKEIMQELQTKFNKEFKITAKNRLRSANDLQFSFIYYYYLVHEKIKRNVSDVFDFFDTDKSGTWSDREIRTLLSKLYDLPLSYMVVDHFEYLLTNCSKDGTFPEVSTPEYERYIDSRLPTISKQLVTSCPLLKEILLEQFGQEDRFKHDTLKNTLTKYVTFKMLTSNVSEVVTHLDEIRRSPGKFNCLNDNLDYEKSEENELVRAVLYDFYLSLFPQQSKFELPPEFRNRFQYKKDLDEWKSYHFKLKLGIYLFVCILMYLTVANLCKKRLFCSLFNKLFC